jgi:ferredoxin
MASGREAAEWVHKDLSGAGAARSDLRRPSDRDFPLITPDIPTLARVRMPERQSSARGGLFEEVALGFDEAQACSEAARCLQCGVCSECLECNKVCGSEGALVHDEVPGEGVEHAGVVIIADPAAAPPVKGEDVIRAYSTKSAGSDVYTMMLRGFAAAAEAMTLLGGSSQRMKGHGLSFTPPAPELSPDLRLGIFICRCDDTFGWPSEWNDYVNGLAGLPDVVHSEVMSSACREEGTGQILRAIREKGLTRVMLASCVCCPLDFICSSCTDQRSRLKDALFKGTGISRAMVETCNLRGEVLRLLPGDPSLAFHRFSGLVERSIGRTRRLKGMPSPARPYNFTTAVIGNSEAAARSATTLAQMGLDVFLLGTPNEPLSQPLHHANIHSFLGSMVKSLRGTVGNFQVAVEVNGQEQILQAGAVILGDRAWQRIPYIPLKDLPPHKVQASMQREGVVGIPFFMPGATSVPGLFLANPPGVNVSERVKGTAAAISAASVMPRSPRNNKGYTVSVDQSLCRGCGRCMQVCPYQAVSFRANGLGGWHAVVDEALCKGCGNCITHCPSSAVDSPYRNRRYLEQMIEEILI